MLVLFETPAGYALFKVSDSTAIKDADRINKHFQSPESAAKVLVG